MLISRRPGCYAGCAGPSMACHSCKHAWCLRHSLLFSRATMTQVALSLCRLCHKFARVVVQHPLTAATRAAVMSASHPAFSRCRLGPTLCWRCCWMRTSGRRCGCRPGCSSACSACAPACTLCGGMELGGNHPGGRCWAPRGSCWGLAPAALWMLSWSWRACRMGLTGQLLLVGLAPVLGLG